MKYLLGIVVILFPFFLAAQEIDEEFQSLTLDELLNVNTNVVTKSIAVNKEEAIKGNTINIGLLLPYSFFNLFSKEIEDAVQLAVDEINNTGGIFSKKLLIIPADDGGDRVESIRKANSLIEEYKVRALIGPTGSTRLQHVAKKVTIPKKVCMITCSASSPKISELVDNDLVWRVTPIDDQESTFAAEYITNDLNKKNIGIIYVNNDYGKSLYSSLVKDFTQKGAKVTGVLRYSSLVNYQTYDLRQRLDTFFLNKPELIYLITNSFEGSMITQKIEDGNYLTSTYNPLFFSCSSNKGNDFLDNSSEKVLESMYGISQKISAKPDFIKRFKEKYRYAPSTSEASAAYDIVYLVAYSMLHANSEISTEYIKSIRKITAGGEVVGINEFAKASQLIGKKVDIDYDGASGKLEFDKSGDILDPEFEIWKITSNKFTIIK